MYKDLLDRAGEMSVVLIFDICNVYEIFPFDWLYSRYWGQGKMVDIASEFLWKIEDWRLFLVCETPELKFQKNYVIPTFYIVT